MTTMENTTRSAVKMESEERKNWAREVIDMKQGILDSKDKTPIEILCEVFKYCQEDYDIWQNEKKLTRLYELLKEFCNRVPEKDDELLNSSKKLVEFWNQENQKQSVRSCDVQLFYALLSFMDYLKSKGIYSKIATTN